MVLLDESGALEGLWATAFFISNPWELFTPTLLESALLSECQPQQHESDEVDFCPTEQLDCATKCAE
ncbi:unnamed protein product [Hymenolepis diminuta]|uniref:Uncharacterized protein n=1 Tax=Hymenolepis diminuta TaxID=6216 RepID=A0A564Y8Y2_HYMDI|nr:unnamed protein product [Hymenolepis diminuta]